MMNPTSIYIPALIFLFLDNCTLKIIESVKALFNNDKRSLYTKPIN